MMPNTITTLGYTLSVKWDDGWHCVLGPTDYDRCFYNAQPITAVPVKIEKVHTNKQGNMIGSIVWERDPD